MHRGAKIAALAVLWIVPMFLFSLAFTSDWPTFWNGVLVPSWKGPFMDLMSISSALKVQRANSDPLIANPADVYQRPMNYPRIWLHLFERLHVNDRNLWIVGISFCVIYLISISWLVGRSESNLEVLALLIAALSLAPLLAMERGNTDMPVFALVLLGCAAGNKYVKPAAYFCAALLKVFPFVAFLIDGARGTWKERRLSVAFAAAALLLLLSQWRDLGAIRQSTPVSTYLSYGLLSLKAQTVYMSGGVFAASCLAAMVIVIVAWLTRPKFEDSVLSSESGNLFLLFGGIYAFTFAIGSNWNYRLIFLLPTLPFAMKLARNTKYAKWALAYIATLLVAENSFALGTYQGIPLGDIATFTLFAMLVAAFLPWMLQILSDIRKVFGAPTNAVISDQRAR